MKLLRHRNRHALIAVDTFLDNLRLDAATMRAPAPSPRLAATLDGRRPLRNATDPVLVPMPAPRRALLGSRPLRPVAVAVATSAVLFGGLASAGALPNPIQHASAQLGSHVGIHIPGVTPTHAIPKSPATIGPDAPATPTQPRPNAQPAAATTTSTPKPSTPTVTTTPVAADPVLPTAPTTPVLTVPDPGKGVPVTLPHLPIPLPSLPKVSLPLPTGVIPR